MEIRTSISLDIVLITVALLFGLLLPSGNCGSLAPQQQQENVNAKKTAQQQEIFHYTSQLVELENLTNKEREQIVDLKNEPFLVSKNVTLLRCSHYRFTFKIYHENHLQSVPKIIRTPRADPKAKIALTSPSGNSIEIIWTTDYPECVDHYKLVVEDLSQQLQKTKHIPSGNNSYEAEGLIPCTEYSVTLDTYSKFGSRRSHRSRVTERTSLANIDLEYFDYSVLENSSILFNWTKLPQVERCDGDYFVKLMPLDDVYAIALEEHVPYTSNTVVVDGLKSCLKYNVSLNANYFDVVASLGEISGAFSRPSNIYGLLVDYDRHHIEWSASKRNPNCVANYTVTVKNIAELVIESLEWNWNQLELERCRMLPISVRQTDLLGDVYPPLEANLEITDDVLNVILEPNISIVRGRSLIVIIPRPPLRNDCQINYTVWWNLEPIPAEDSEELTFVIGDLEYCTNNVLTIQMEYMDSKKIFKKEVFYEGTSAQSIANLTYTFDDTNEVIEITWDTPDGFKLCNFTYVVETNQFQTITTDEYYSIPWENEEIPVDVSIQREFSGKSPSQGITIRAPFAPVTNVRHTNLDKGRTRISWSKPDTNSKIDKYIVIWDNKMEEVPSGTTSLTDSFTKCVDNEIFIAVKYPGQSSPNVSYIFQYVVEPEPVKYIRHQFENPYYKLSWDVPSENIQCYKSFIITSPKTELSVVQEFEYLLKSWADNEDYTFDIVAMYDDSHKSRPVKHTIVTPGGVKELTMKENEQNTIDIEWPRPENPDHTPIEYILNVDGKNYTVPHPHITVDSVPFCVELEISVWVRYDTGVMRSSVFNKKILKAPGAVRKVEIAVNHLDIITISWQAPKHNPNCATSYKLQLNDKTSLVSELRYEVSDWEPCHVLNVTIAAQNTDGETGPEKFQSFKTPQGIVSSVTEMQVITTEKTLQVKWQEPEKSKHCVTGYRVVIWDEVDKGVIYSHENESMFLVLEEMKACWNLMVQVTPLAKSGDGLPSQLEAVIKPRAPGVLSPVKSIEILSRSLKLQTTFDDEHYLCPLQDIQITCVDTGNIAIMVNQDLKKMLPKRNQTFDLLVEGLRPYEQYECFAQLTNSFDLVSPPSFNTTHQTLEDISDAPVDLLVIHRAYNLVKFTWKEPLTPNGKITHYEVIVNELDPLYHVPKRCDEKKLRINTTLVEKEFRVENVKAYTSYEISVRAINGAGVGKEIAVTDETEPYVPETPTLQSLGTFGPFNAEVYDATAEISWKFPCAINGKFEQFLIILRGRHAQTSDEIKSVYTETSVRDDYGMIFKDLLPSYDYEAELFVTIPHHNSTMISVKFRAPPAVPNFVSVNEIQLNMTLNPSQGGVLNISKRNLLASGDILYYAIMISEMDCQTDPVPQRQIINTTDRWPEVMSWSDVRSDGCQRQYQATPERFSEGLYPVSDVEAKDAEADANEFLEILIGHENCDSGQHGRFCNGPLRAGSKYAVVLRVFTETGFADNQFIVIETISEIQLTIIILLVITCLTSAFIAGLMIMLRKRHHKIAKDSIADGSKKLSGVGDILTKNFPEHFDDLSKNNCERLNMEYNVINSCGQGQSTSYAVAKLNASKNRYTNVLPFDFNRVILDRTDEEGDTDYINASFINGYRKPQDYIASQGPKMDSSYDFWRMIVQFKVSSVIMLTSYREGEKEKCHEYFPSNVSETLQFSDITIKCQKEMDFPNHKKRIFSIEKNNVSYTVNHYHFLKWPDYSCPSDPNDLIDFTRIVTAERKHPANPMIVHCSAGVGRTGTFIALDIALQQMRAEKKINVLEIVKDLRRQRMKMVQSFSQYLLLYQCIVIILKQNEASEPVWKRLSKKTNLRSGPCGATKKTKTSFGIHNFGMLPTTSLRECSSSGETSKSSTAIMASDLQGTISSSDLLENNSNSLNMKSLAAASEFAVCFEPEDSIT